MTIVAQPRRLRAVPGNVERRWRLAALVGLVIVLGLAAYALIVIGPGAASSQMVPVLRAAKAIRAGTVITADELSVTDVRTQDASVLATLVLNSDRSQVIGQVASMDIPSGDLIPAAIAAPASTGSYWKVDVPIRRMPADLAPGDHVALMVSGTGPSGSAVDFVFIQDVRVLDVGGGSVDLWLPAKLAPQVEWYADHGGIVLMTMQPGQVQSQVPAGGGS